MVAQGLSVTTGHELSWVIRRARSCEGWLVEVVHTGDDGLFAIEVPLLTTQTAEIKEKAQW